jgi:HTH-type transcriptional regulator / antitoxin HigA
MAMHSNEDPHADVGSAYLELVSQFPLRPIRSDTELDRAIAVINSLIRREDLAPDEEDYLDVLSDLVEKYEAEQHPMPPVSDADLLRYLIEAKGVTQAKVAAETGIAESTISEILSGRRELNRRHIEVLAAYFHVNPSAFIPRE